MRRAAGAAALGAAGLLAVGCGGGGKDRDPLIWKRAPQVFKVRGLPRDRVVVGRVRNRSGRSLHLVAARLVVRDARGRALRGATGFTSNFAHGLFGAFQQPSSVPDAELRRLGKIVDIPPSGEAPFFATWRLGPGSREPVRVAYSGGALTIPPATRLTAR